MPQQILSTDPNAGEPIGAEEILSLDPNAGKPEPSWSDLPGNILPSAGRLVKDLGHGLMSLVKNVGDPTLPFRMAQGVRDAGGVGAVAGNVGAGLKDRYVTNLKHTAIEDPVGLLSDVTGLASMGAPALAKGGLATAAKVAKGIGAANPLEAAVGAAGKGWQTLGKATANRADAMMGSALKVPKVLQQKNKNVNFNQEMLKGKVPVDQSGYDKLEGVIRQADDANAALVDEAQAAGVTADPRRVLAGEPRALLRTLRRTEDVDPKALGTARESIRHYWQKNSKPGSDLVRDETVPIRSQDPPDYIDVVDESTTPSTDMVATGRAGPDPDVIDVEARVTERRPSKRRTPVGIPIKRAQEAKQRLGHKLATSFGKPDVTQGAIEADQALRVGLRKEIERAVPGIAANNAKESIAIPLQEAILARMQTFGNQNVIPMRAALGSALLSPFGASVPMKLLGGALGGAIDDPRVLSRLAIGTNNAGRRMSGAGRVAGALKPAAAPASLLARMQALNQRVQP